jgi:hypothetical protein
MIFSLISHGLNLTCVFLAPFCPNVVPARRSSRRFVPVGMLVLSQSWQILRRGTYPIRTVIQFSRCIGDLQAQFSEKRRPFPYIQKVGKERKNAWISTLIEMEMKYATEAHCSGKIERSACRGF